MENKLPTRDDEIYKEIESFKNYELTQCIIYELAIRNKHVKEHIDKIHSAFTYAYNNYCYNRKYNKILKKSVTRLEHCYSEVSLYDFLFGKEIKYLENEENEINDIIKNLPLNDALGTSSGEEEELEKAFLNFKDLYIRTKEHYRVSKIITKNILEEHAHFDDLIENYKIFESSYNTLMKDYYFNYLDIPKNGKEDKTLELRSKSQQLSGNSKSIYKNNNDKKSMLQSERKQPLDIDYRKYYFSINSSSELHLDANVLPKFSRPRLINKLNDKTFGINIDFSAPIKEITSYIKTVAQNFASSENTSTTKEERKKKEYDLELPYKYIINKSKEISLQQKWADWFFAYDFYVTVRSQEIQKTDDSIYTIIDDSLTTYYSISNGKYYDISNYRKKIIPTMRDLIDNAKYKELLRNNLNTK